MGYRYQVPGFARASVVLTLSVLVSTVAPPQVGLAQSAPPPLTPWRGLVDHASVNVNGQASQASVDLTAKSLSADGRFVLMTSYASDLVSDQSSYRGVFLRDRASGTTRRVSVSHDGTTPQNGSSVAGSMSANARQIAFTSSAANLVQGDTNGVRDVFVRDLDAERTVRVSVATAGTQTDADSYSPVISATGRFVAFASQASNLAPGGVPYQPAQVFVHDRDVNGNGIFDEPGSRATSVVSVSPGGARANDWTRNIRISGDGRVVLFESRATNLLPGTLDGTNHVYVHDRQLHQTTLVDRAVTGGPASWGAEADSSDLSDDGRYVTFSSVSPDLAPGMNWSAQVFRHDRADPTPNATAIVSRRPDGAIADDSTYSTAISGDGRYVVLRTVATNLASPSPVDGRGSVIVRDMADGTLTRVDVIGDGSALNHWYPYSVSISADGTAVAFNSDATNAVYSPNPSAQHVFVVTAFAAAPASASYPMAGGAGSIDVSTLPPTGWNAISLDPWITLTSGAGFDAGPRVVSYSVGANPAPIVRDGRIQLGSMLVTIHQDGDGDPTPPVIAPLITGATVNGWYTSDITLHWDVSDPESPFLIDAGCHDDVFTTDFAAATPGCSVTSRGGTSSLSVLLRRDTTAPAISITAPAIATYPLNVALAPDFACADGGGSGVGSCTVTSPMDTSTPGRKIFTVTATDLVGKSSTDSVEYTVGTGVCVAPHENVQAWFRFEHNGADVYGLDAAPVPNGTVYYEPAAAGAGLRGQGDTYLEATDAAGRLRLGQQMTIAAWVASSGAASSSATVVASAGQYRLGVFPDMSLRWAFNVPSGFDWVDTGVQLTRRADIFTHVAVTYDAGLVNTYINGRLAHSRQLDGVVSSPGTAQSITIGGRADQYTPFHGVLDELQLYSAALVEGEIEAIALAGNGSLCQPQTTTLTLIAPASVGYLGEATVSAQLLDLAGQPVAGKPVSIDTYLSADGASTGGGLGMTDVDGKVTAQIRLGSNSPVETYPNGVRASFQGDARYRGSYASAAASVVRGMPALTWTPAAITHGTPLGPQQLNATANTTGTFSYAQPAGTVLPAGTQTLGVVFVPEDQSNWLSSNKRVTLEVAKATPVVTWVPPADVIYGTPLSALQLNVSTGVPGTYEFSPAPGTILPAGTKTLSVAFTPEDTANYNTAAASVVLNVLRATPIVGWVTPADLTYGAPLGSGQLSATAGMAGTFTYSPAAGTVLSAGSHALAVTFTPDDGANYAHSTGSRLVTVARAPLTVTAGNASKPFGQPLPAFTSTLSGFVNGDTMASLGGALGYATPATASSAVGSYAIVPSGVSSPNYSITFVNGTLSVVKAATVVTAAASPNPVGFDQPVTFTANVGLAAPGLGAPTGYVQFFTGGTLIGSVPFMGGPVYLTTAGLPAGTHTLTASYSGDGNLTGSSSTAPVTFRTAAMSSSLTLSASEDPSKVGQAVRFTAAVSGPAGTISGSVGFYDGATLLGTAPIAGSTASFTTSSLAAGGHAVTARFSGSPSVPPSVSAAFAHTVQPSNPKPKATTTTIATSPSPAALGSEVALTATVLGSPNKVPTGTIVFFANGTVIGTAALSATGSATAAATLRLSTLPHGGHSISAVYLADATHRASSAAVRVTVN